MEDYLKEFGISPQELGIDRYFKTKSATERIEKNTRTDQTSVNHKTGFDRFSNIMLKDLPLTMAYVPFQQIEGTYNQEEALKMGTLFANLNKPFLGRKV